MLLQLDGKKLMSRFFIGSGLLALVAASLSVAALAQDRGQLRRRLIERLSQTQAAPSDPNPTQIVRPGTYRFHFTHGGLTRHYIVHVPARRAREAAPVLVALHGGGGNMEYQANNYGLIEKSEQAGFVAVFPNGYSRFPSGKFATWNAGKCCGQARDRNIDDVGFVNEVIRRVGIQAQIDLSRVFVTGMSNGGLMAYRLACESPLIRGIAPVAGTDNTVTCIPKRPVPVIHFHARDDTHVLFDGGAGKDAFRRSDAVTQFSSVPATIAKWVAINGADKRARRVLSVSGATCDLHAAGPRGGPVQLCVTRTGGHSWPGVASKRKGKSPSMAISANDLIWNFFLSL